MIRRATATVILRAPAMIPTLPPAFIPRSRSSSGSSSSPRRLRFRSWSFQQAAFFYVPGHSDRALNRTVEELLKGLFNGCAGILSIDQTACAVSKRSVPGVGHRAENKPISNPLYSVQLKWDNVRRLCL